MAKYSKRNSVSDQTQNEAMAIAKGIQKPSQTKEQTKLIAQGIQKGIDQYKKQQKAKSRELNKQKKKDRSNTDDVVENNDAVQQSPYSKIPWILLVISWLLFSVYIIITW